MNDQSRGCARSCGSRRGVTGLDIPTSLSAQAYRSESAGAFREHYALSNDSYGRPRMTMELREAGLDVGKRCVWPVDEGQRDPARAHPSPQGHDRQPPPVWHCSQPSGGWLYHELLASMSRKGNRFDNSAVETFFKSLKAERLWRQNWPTRRKATAAIFQYINGFYIHVDAISIRAAVSAPRF
ncbi:IS3 family transposase orfB [Komagataeibacter xylinus E25]|nr:IS3 family transposase orfB [Komagataeibacter xylinus E25]